MTRVTPVESGPDSSGVDSNSSGVGSNSSGPRDDSTGRGRLHWTSVRLHSSTGPRYNSTGVARKGGHSELHARQELHSGKI